MMTIVANAFDSWIEHSTILVGVNKDGNVGPSFAADRLDFINKIQKSADWFQGQVQEGLEAFDCQRAQASCTDATADDLELFFPGADGFEVEGCHIVMVALLKSVADCLNVESQGAGAANPFSPSKTKVDSEAVLVGHKRYVRKVDVVLSKEGQAVIVLYDQSMKLCFELMPLSRTRQKTTDLVAEKRDQAVGHMAKSVAVCSSKNTDKNWGTSCFY